MKIKKRRIYHNIIIQPRPADYVPQPYVIKRPEPVKEGEKKPQDVVE